MKILLLTPRFNEEFSKYPPALGLAYMSAVLKENGYKDVTIVDASKYSSLEGFREELKILKPEIVGISTMSMFADLAFKSAKIVKETTNAVTVLGGPHPTTQPLETIRNKYVDYIICGESEYSFLELVKQLDKKKKLNVEGLVYKKGKKIISYPKKSFIDLDKLPLPDRDALPMEKYLKKSPILALPYPATSIAASRGCPYNCLFCQPTLRKLFGNRIRYRNPKKVVEEMQMLKDKYKVKGIFFIDDEPTLNPKWVIELCKEIIRTKLKVKWGCAGRIDTLSEEMLNYMKKAGCIQIGFGVESLSQKILNFYRKGTTPERIKKAMEMCQKCGIIARANLMIGAPEEDLEDVEKSIEFIRECKPDFIFTAPTTPMMGTDLYEYCRENKFLIGRHGNYGNISTMKRRLSDREVQQAIKKIVKTYKREMIKIALNPITLYKRRYLFKEVFNHFWTLLIGNPKLLLNEIKYYMNYEGKEKIND